MRVIAARSAFVLCAILSLLGPTATVGADPPDRPSLERDLRSEDPEQRLKAALVILKEIAPADREALRVLRAGLRANTPRRREDVIDLARRNSSVLNLLIENGVDQKVDAEARKEVLNEVKELGLLAKEAIPRFILCLEESPEIAASAAEVLGAMQGEAEAAIPALEKRIKNDRTPFWQVDLRVAKMARGLVQIEPSNTVAISYFTRLLSGWDYDIRSPAVYGLRDCPKLPPETITRLERIANKDPYENLRSVAAEILNKQKATREEK